MTDHKQNVMFNKKLKGKPMEIWKSPYMFGST